jgi:large subunit ribosomal protein L28
VAGWFNQRQSQLDASTVPRTGLASESTPEFVMSRVCSITGKGPLVGNRVSHSNIKTKMRQLPNLQYKRLWVPELDQYLRIRVSTRALRSIAKMGFVAFCQQNGIEVVRMADDMVVG